MSRNSKIIISAIRKAFPAAAAIISLSAVDLAVFWLYDLMMEPFFYCLILKGVILLIIFAIFLIREFSAANKRYHIMNGPDYVWGRELQKNIDKPDLRDSDYISMISTLADQLKKADGVFDSERRDMVDYYTAWVHQIKTPIAVMRLELQDKDTAESRALLSELFRIERYVDMVLQYVRLGSSAVNDIVVGEYSIEELVRESVRKYASQFIVAKVKFSMGEITGNIVTDKKWFSVIIEQILSNAIKYAPEGQISITFSTETKELRISDTGVGISEADLPRIFEKGYTGKNGRLSVNSSGIGLYLCKSAADKLNIPIRAESRVGEGTTFILDLSVKKTLID